MQDPKSQTVQPAFSHLAKQSVADHSESRDHHDMLALRHDETAQLSCRLGDASCASAHSDTLNRAPAYPASRTLLRLQRHYGNRFVQRVVTAVAQKHNGSQTQDAIAQAAFGIETTQRQAEEEEESPRRIVDPSAQRQMEEEEDEGKKISNAQTKLTLGAPDDVYEQEANQVAAQVTNFYNSDRLDTVDRSLLSAVDVATVLGLADIPQRSISHTVSNARRWRIFTNAGAQSAQPQVVDPASEQRIIHSKGGGSPLPAAINTTMALQTGYDFSNVRVKTDNEAAELNSNLHARAFTLGSDIWLGKNESMNDVNLMAHELTHVVQQGAAARVSPKRVAGFEHMHSSSKVREHLQALMDGQNRDSSIYRKAIDQFQQDNTFDQIESLQRQVLEKSDALSIHQKNDSQILRFCGGCGGSCTAPAARATPTNFRQTAGRDAGSGVLHFEYAWDSSSGNLADLSDVEVGEIVDYAPFDSPPFVVWDNPTIIWLPGTRGGFQDNHSVGVMKPYSAKTKSATQHYRYRRSGGTPVNIMGPISIERKIESKSDGNYKYKITKSRVSAEVDPLP